MYNKVKKQVHILLHPTEGNTRWDKLLNGFLISLILLNLIALMLETEHSFYEKHKFFFDTFDKTSVAIFSLEYILRLWSCTHDPRYHHWFWGRLKYMVSLEAMIDLLAILPFYLSRFRLASYMKATKVIVNVFKSRFQELLIAFIMTTGLIIIAACLMYFAEHNKQPEIFKSIPDTLYWAVTTLTTIGYGDMVPKTGIGRLLTGFIAMAGVALFALPAGIITAGFLEEINKSRKTQHIICPHCGKPIETGTHTAHP
jgi:voltage-gated potassium channel